MTPLDRTAAAIYERHYALRPVSGLPTSWERCPESEREHWRRVAEAAIEPGENDDAGS